MMMVMVLVLALVMVMPMHTVMSTAKAMALTPLIFNNVVIVVVKDGVTNAITVAIAVLMNLMAMMAMATGRWMDEC